MKTESWRRHWRAAALLSTLLPAAPPVLALGDSTAVPPQHPFFVLPTPETATFLCHYNLNYQRWAQPAGYFHPAPECGGYVVVTGYEGGTDAITGYADGYCGRANPHTGDCSCRYGEHKTRLAEGGAWRAVMWDQYNVTFECFPD